MNEADSEQLKSLLVQNGFGLTDNYKDAGIIIMNTCCVRRKAEEKAYQYLNQFQSHKRQNRDIIIALGGCLGQQKKGALLKKFPGLDLVFGTETLLKVPLLVKDIEEKRGRIADAQWDKEGKILSKNIEWVKNGKVTGFVPISRGCNNLCSYCIVPLTRGEEKNRPFQTIIEDVENAVRSGIKEITVLGQNVNSYRDGDKNFADLLAKLDKVDGLKRIRFMTSHPRDLSEEIIQEINGCRKVCEHYHLPLQSGSNRILELMDRGYTIEEYDKKIKTIRKLKPCTAITTDIIVGFPDETEKDFEETLNYIKETEFDSAFTFVYSERPGTKARELEDSVPDTVKKSRLQKIIDLQENISARKNMELLNKKVDVLIEQKLFGKTRTGKSVVFKREVDLIGHEVSVQIIGTGPHTLIGEKNGGVDTKRDCC